METFDAQTKLFSHKSDISAAGVVAGGGSPRGGFNTFQDTARLGDTSANQVAATGIRRDGPLRRFRDES